MPNAPACIRCARAVLVWVNSFRSTAHPMTGSKGAPRLVHSLYLSTRAGLRQQDKCDATGRLLELYFTPQESFFSYCTVACRLHRRVAPSTERTGSVCSLHAVCDLKRIRHRVAQYITARLAYVAAMFNILLDLSRLLDPDPHADPYKMSIARFSL